MAGISNIASAFDPSPIRELAERVGAELRLLKPDHTRVSTLDQLARAVAPLGTLIPELNRYDLTTPDGRREFPRTVCSLSLLGCLLRASDAVEVQETKVGGATARWTAGQTLISEFETFTRTQPPEHKLAFQEFKRLVDLFRGTARDPQATLTIVVSVIMGDLCKMPEVKTALRDRIPVDVTDHDIALRQALVPGNLGLIADVFSTLASLPEDPRRRIQGEVTHGINLGHVLQVETCAAGLTPLKTLAASNPEAARDWFLATIVDIFGARADEKRPETWGSSELANRNLVPALLIFEARLPELASADERTFFDDFQAAVAQRPFYSPIFAAAELSPEERETVYRLARFFSFETDGRPLHHLIDSWSDLTSEKRGLIVNYFMNSGFDPSDPKPIVSYLPYIFTQMYARHFELPVALQKSLEVIADLSRQIKRHESGKRFSSGIRNYSAQGVWFERLRGMDKERLSQPIVFKISELPGQTPEILLT